MPVTTTFDAFTRAAAATLRANDRPPATRGEWDARRTALRDAILAAIGPMPTKPCPLNPQVLGTLDRTGYRVEKVIFQSRPDVWVTANLYVPDGSGRRPAVLAVHGHHDWARIDPTVQSYCIGLAKLGFVVLCVDAFGAGERHATPAKGNYHGALDGSALWPVGQTLLGMQVYDNRRAVDYLLTRPEVDPAKLGVTGASGGGNQSMYAGALDDRIKCVVPVCSVGNYQAFLQTACCVCEVLPGALTFTEEGDVLGLIAPRPLLVVSASKDAIQFSPAEAAKSVERVRAIYGLHAAGDAVKHTIIDDGHGYSRPMREAMYGWMTKCLKGEGDGSPIAEPAFQTDDPETIRCYPDPAKRPKPWLTPTTFALRVGKALLEENFAHEPEHPEEWESSAVYMRSQFRKLLGPMPVAAQPAGREETTTAEGVTTRTLTLTPEPDLPMGVTVKSSNATTERRPAVVMLHLDGRDAALKHLLAAELVKDGWAVAAPNLRATGDAPPPRGEVHGAVDHNSAEHAVWIGRPLVGQWLTDVQAVLDWLATQPTIDRRHVLLAGIGPAGLVALIGGGLWDDRIAGVIAVDSPVSYLTDAPYGSKMRMGVLLPGVVSVGDVPQLAALMAPRRLVFADGMTPHGERLKEKELTAALSFATDVYRVHKAADKLTLATGQTTTALVAAL
jgi:dienelactone hydrolase